MMTLETEKIDFSAKKYPKKTDFEIALVFDCIATAL
jgi:hypothetical protein